MADRSILLIRHGETEWNRSGRFQGKLDSPLTEQGQAQARAIGKYLGGIADGLPKTWLASPLGRTRQTAGIIAGCGPFPAFAYDERLAEVSVGSWDGLTYLDIEYGWPGVLDGSTPFDWYFRSPDGETYAQATARVTSWLADLDSSALVVSHGLIGRVIRGVFAGLSAQEALCLPVPQDVIWHLHDRTIDTIPVPPGAVSQGLLPGSEEIATFQHPFEG